MSNSNSASRLRVLMISDVYFPRINGVSTSIQTFREGLADNGVDVHILAPRYNNEENESHITRVPARPVPRDPEDRMLPWRLTRKMAVEAAQHCDLVHIQTPFVAHYAGLHAARRCNKPVMATYHTLFEEYLHHYIPFLPSALLRGATRAFSRSQCNALDAMVVPSTAMKNRLGEYGVTTPMQVLPTGIPMQRFSNGHGAEFRRRFAIPAERPVALYVGRLGHEKNVGFLLQMMQIAVRTRPDWMLLITGEGPARESLQKQAQQLGLQNNVQFIGYLDRNSTLLDAYAAADVFVFASRTETQGLVLLEAMAMNCPVLALAEMGTVDILKPQRGCMIAQHDPAAFAASLNQLINNPHLRQQLAVAARTYAQEWSDTAMAARLAQLYRQMVNGEALATNPLTAVKN
ncbi:MAG TPA: glycosyltransferase [Gammaproteobacteria bacterium]|nr:glycosyltransferase [Gammaproteobacteria bacterium]